MSPMIKRFSIILTILCAAIGGSAQESTPDPSVPPVVTMYRGGTARTGAIDAAPLTAQPSIAWEFPVARPIRMTPAYADGRVYIGSEAGVLYAIDAESGAELWRFDAGASLVSTPAIDADGRLFVGALDGTVYALDAVTGASIWSADLGGEVYASPLLLDDRVIIGSTNGQLAAYSPDDGARMWQIDLKGAAWSSPALASLALVSPAETRDVLITVAVRSGSVVAVNAADGAEVWRFTVESGFDATPAVVGEMIYIGGYDGNLYALDARTGSEVWRHDLDAPIYASAAVTADAVYVNALSGRAVALDRLTGEARWTIEIGAPAYASPVVVGTVAYFVTERDALLIAVDAETGETLWEINTGYQGDWRASSALIVGDMLWIGSNEPTRGLIALRR